MLLKKPSSSTCFRQAANTLLSQRLLSKEELKFLINVSAQIISLAIFAENTDILNMWNVDTLNTS